LPDFFRLAADAFKTNVAFSDSRDYAEIYSSRSALYYDTKRVVPNPTLVAQWAEVVAVPPDFQDTVHFVFHLVAVACMRWAPSERPSAKLIATILQQLALKDGADEWEIAVLPVVVPGDFALVLELMCLPYISSLKVDLSQLPWTDLIVFGLQEAVAHSLSIKEVRLGSRLTTLPPERARVVMSLFLKSPSLEQLDMVPIGELRHDRVDKVDWSTSQAFSEDVTPLHAELLLRFLVANTSVTNVSLRGLAVGAMSPDVHAALAAVLTSPTSRLAVLELRHASLTGDAATTVLKALADNTTVVTLALGHNALADAGALALSQALGTNRTVATLDLCATSIGNVGGDALGAALATNGGVTTLSVLRNDIGDDGVKALGTALKSNRVLSSLFLGQNALGDEGAQRLAEGLRGNSTLTVLQLADNKIGDAGVYGLLLRRASLFAVVVLLLCVSVCDCDMVGVYFAGICFCQPV
jgi:hypothetical protein